MEPHRRGISFHIADIGALSAVDQSLVANIPKGGPQDAGK